MALYRGDPVLESLRDVGNSLRTVTGDVLQRRRLDVEEQGVLGRQESERNLQQLRTQAATAAGETSLLQARGDVAMKQQGMELAQRADVRAGESHGLQMETGQFGLERGRQLLPGELQEQKDRSMQMRASAAASAASADASRAQAAWTNAQRAEALKPVPNAVWHAMAGGVPEVQAMIETMLPADGTMTMLGAQNRLNLMEKFDPAGMAGIRVAGLQRALERPNLSPDEEIKLREQLQQAQTAAKQRTGDEHEVLGTAIAIRSKVLSGLTDRVQREKVGRELNEMLDVYLGMKGKAAGGLPKDAFEFLNQNPRISEKELDLIRQNDPDHSGLGTFEDWLRDKGKITQRQDYMTPDQLYRKAQVPPATADEMSLYKNGGQDQSGKTLPPNPDIKTQQDADAFKRRLRVQELHQLRAGNRQQLEADMQGSTAPRPAPTPTLQSARPAPSPEATARTEAERRLRTGRGVMATPEQIQQETDRVLRERTAADTPEALRAEARRRLLSSGRRTTVPTEAQIEQMVQQIVRERQRQGTGSIPGTGATDLQDR